MGKKQNIIDWKMLAVDTQKRREKEAIGIREFARNVGLSPSTISRIENGKRCDAETLITITEYLEYGVYAYVVKP